MTNFGFRKLVLSAVGAAFVFSPLAPESKAEDVARIGKGRQAEWTVKIGSNKSEPDESTGIVISPSRLVGSQVAGEPEVPILVAPDYDEEPAEKSGEKKSGKKPAKASSKKAEKSSVATETASQKAREEWQKKEPADGAKRQPKGKDSTTKNGEKTKDEKASRKATDDSSLKVSASKAARAALEARKRAMAAQAKAKAATASAESKSKATASTAAAAAKAQAMTAKRAAALKDSRSYREIYNSIPFSRAEYDANPGYRHLATMEIMLGQLHPIIVAPPAPPRRETKREITVRFLPAIRPGYRPYSQYPWH